MRTEKKSTIFDVSKLGEFIEQSHFGKNYVRRYHSQVGSTIVYPIQIWINPHYDGVDDVELQLDCDSCKQWQERMLKKLAKEIEQEFGVVVTDVHITRNDGSCADEGHIYIKR